MSPVSKSVVAFGFRPDSHSTKVLEDIFRQNHKIRFLDNKVNGSDLENAAGAILGKDFNYQDPQSFSYISKAVLEGLNLLVMGFANSQTPNYWSELLGVMPTETKSVGEWFFKSQSGASLTTERIDQEFAAAGNLTLLEIIDADPVLITSIGFKDFVTAAQKNYPSSQAFTLGLEPTVWPISKDIAAIIRRAVNQRSEYASVPNQTLGVGIVGYGPYGGMGHYHGRAATVVEGLDLIAVVDRDPDRRKAAEQEFPSVRTYKTAEELANDPEVDICIVATPPVSHAELSTALLQANKHVICEKPMCLTYTEAKMLIDKAAEMNKMFTINQNRRWDRDFMAISRAIERGKIGNVFNLETFVGGFEHPCRAWHSEESISGGAIYDWGSHHIDQIIQIYGSPPLKVSATSHKRVWHDITNDDQIRVHMLWEDGREAEFFQSDIAAHRKPKYFIQGTNGTIIGNYRPVIDESVSFPFGYQEHEYHHAEAPADLKLSRYESEYGLIEEVLPPAKAQQFAFHKNVADHLLMGEPLSVTPQSVAGVVAVLEAAQISAKNGSDYISIPQDEL